MCEFFKKCIQWDLWLENIDILVSRTVPHGEAELREHLEMKGVYLEVVQLGSLGRSLAERIVGTQQHQWL